MSRSVLNLRVTFEGEIDRDMYIIKTHVYDMYSVAGLTFIIWNYLFFYSNKK